MNDLRIDTDYDAFYPGSDVRVSMIWDLSDETTSPEKLELRLSWSTSGKGTQDTKVVQSHTFENLQQRGQREATLTLPWGPYSFSGQLISLIWTLELVIFPDETTTRKEIIIGPNAEEVLIGVALQPS